MYTARMFNDRLDNVSSLRRICDVNCVLMHFGISLHHQKPPESRVQTRGGGGGRLYYGHSIR